MLTGICCIGILFQERVVYNKEVQTVQGSFEPQGPTADELREQIKEEFAKEEALRLELLEAERLEAEAVVPQEAPGNERISAWLS